MTKSEEESLFRFQGDFFENCVTGSDSFHQPTSNSKWVGETDYHPICSVLAV